MAVEEESGAAGVEEEEADTAEPRSGPAAPTPPAALAAAAAATAARLARGRAAAMEAGRRAIGEEELCGFAVFPARAHTAASPLCVA